MTEESDGVVITAQHPQQPGLMIGLPVLITWNQLDHVIEDLTAIYAWHRNEQGIYDQ
ncbi:hypothetical protein [Tamaricihabitans halophyticus]|uniref:hypothetical protein n=1 Tax=Tamaricihabitans halophyticus TaxID=1262583 RepID=UPI001404F4F7|nr:hypothetical protein [Tamaricihabitans halophyticus]